MPLWLRVAAILVIYGSIETVDYHVAAFSFPWWLSLIMAAFLSVSDIVLIAIIDAHNP